METKVAYEVLQTSCKPDTLSESVQVSRAELEHEHLHLLARLHQLRRLLGYPPLLTGKKLRQQAGE